MSILSLGLEVASSIKPSLISRRDEKILVIEPSTRKSPTTCRLLFNVRLSNVTRLASLPSLDKIPVLYNTYDASAAATAASAR